jgi:UDP-N-acetyl-D-mannosaminuronic acid dehydrogenase
MLASIIGGGGHVGLPFGLTLSHAGHDVVLIDNNPETLSLIGDGVVPFSEPGAEELLHEGLADGSIRLADSVEAAAGSDVITVVVGTPVDDHHNPEMRPLIGVVEDLIPHLRGGELVVLRSTVYPGTTDLVHKMFADAGLVVGEDVFLAFCPERVTQHRSIEEIVSLPQLIGAFEEASYARAEAFFGSFIDSETHRLTPIEAELGKLFTNMWRYIEFAVANEFYLIAESFATTHDVNVHRIIEQTAKDYPRFSVASPGPNVGGPCLTKDGWFLVDRIPYNEFVSTAYRVNEGMPAQILDRMAGMAPDPEKVAVLGMTFKADSDDTRNSLSFKLRDRLLMMGVDVAYVEPNVEGYDDLSAVDGADWVILMTPHRQFADLGAVRRAVDNDDAVYCDIWGLWPEMKYASDNGYFRGYDVAAAAEADVAEAVTDGGADATRTDADAEVGR